MCFRLAVDLYGVCAIRIAAKAIGSPRMLRQKLPVVTHGIRDYSRN